MADIDTLEPSNCSNCGFLRRIGCIMYDSVVIAALWMLAALPVVLILGDSVQAGKQWFQIYLWLIAGAYFIWFWGHGGQTLGMQAWHVKLVSAATTRSSSAHLLIRYVIATISLAVFGIGLIWAVGHPRSMTWYDLASKTRLVHEKSA